MTDPVEVEVKRRIAEALQQEYAEHIYRDIRDIVTRWRTGVRRDNDRSRMAKLMGVELRAPKFLDRLTEALDSVVLKDES